MRRSLTLLMTSLADKSLCSSLQIRLMWVKHSKIEASLVGLLTRPNAILTHNDLVQLLQRSLGGWLIQRNTSVLEKVDTVADFQNLRIVMRNHNHGDLTIGFEFADEIKYEATFFSPHCGEW